MKPLQESVKKIGFIVGADPRVCPNKTMQVNITIMRAFVKLREMIASHKNFTKRLGELKNKYDAQFRVVFDAIRQLMASPEPKQSKIGFIKEKRAKYRIAWK